MSIVSTQWLEDNFNKVKIIDCSWHLPNTNRNPYNEFNYEHIKNAIYFDLDKNSESNTDLPHMMPNKNTWENILSSIGISNKDEIVIYDNSDLFSSCRCWFSFIYFGHNQNLVHVLDGGFKKWKLENRKISNKKNKVIKTKYKASENDMLIKTKKQIDENIIKKDFFVIDARSKKRFYGLEKEPRKNLKSGSIPNSYCMPFTELINSDHTFKKKEEIQFKFSQIVGSNNEKEIVFSCGSGVTAAVLALVYSLINNKNRSSIYDGSWAEYGRI